MGIANVRAGTQKRRALFWVPARTLANPIARYVLEYPFVLPQPARRTVTRYESKIREALAWPIHGQPLLLKAQGVVALAAPMSPRVGCQNQYVGWASVLPSGPSWMVMPCSSVGWKYLRSNTKGCSRT